MRLKITLTLLVILLGLLVYIFYIDWDPDRQRTDAADGGLGPITAELSFIRIHNPSEDETLRLEKQGKRWMLIEPFVWPANEFAVQRIITQLRFLKKETSFLVEQLTQTGATLADYGLSPADLLLEFGSGDNRYQIGIGKATEIGDNLYILSVDRQYIHVVDRDLLDSLSIDIESLRDPRIFTASVFEVSSWNLQRREANNIRSRLTRNGDNWFFETPIRARADSPAVNAVLNRILQLQATSITVNNAVDLSSYGLQNPAMRIAVETENQREVLEVGDFVNAEAQNKSFRYAKREDRPTVFRIEAGLEELLADMQTRLRDRHILGLDPTQATSIAIARMDEEPLTLQRLENDEWEILIRDAGKGIVTIKADPLAVERTLERLQHLKAVPETGFINDAPTAQDLESYGLEVPRQTISVTSKWARGANAPYEVSRTEMLYLGSRLPDKPEQRYVKLRSVDYVYSIYADALEGLESDPSLFKDRSIFNLPSDAKITSLSIERLADQEIVFRLDDPEASELPPAAQAILKELPRLRAARYLPGEFASTVDVAGQSVPWAYLLSFTIDLQETEQDEAQSYKLYLSQASGPLLVGGYEAEGEIFRLEQAFIDAFGPLVFPRVKRDLPAEPFDLPETEAGDRPQPSPEATGESEEDKQTDEPASSPTA